MIFNQEWEAVQTANQPTLTLISREKLTLEVKVTPGRMKKEERCQSDSWMCSGSGSRFPSGCLPAVGGLRFKD